MTARTVMRTARQDMPALLLPLGVLFCAMVAVIGAVVFIDHRLQGLPLADAALLLWIVSGAALTTVAALLVVAAQRRCARFFERLSRNRVHHSRLYQTLLRLSPDAVMIVRLDGALVSANLRAAHVLGYESVSALLAHVSSVGELVAPADAEALRARLDETSATSASGVFVFTVNTRVGGCCELELSAAPILDARGAPSAIMLAARDLAPRKALQERLARHELEVRIVLDHVHEHVVYLDPALRVRWANHAARAAARHPSTPDACEGHTCHMLWHQRATPCADCPVVRCLHSQQPEAGELRTPSGRWWSIKAHPVFGPDHALAGIIQLSHEITERMRAQEELRQQLRHQQLIAALAARLVPTAALDALVQPTLADIGTALGVERVCIWRSGTDDTVFDCAWHWHAPSVTELAGEFEHVRRDDYQWVQRQIHAHGYAALHDTTQLPPDAVAEKALCDRLNVRANVLIPMYARGVMNGFLTCDCMSACHTWTDAEIALLRMCAEVLMHAFERAAAEARTLQYQHQLELLVDERTAKLQRANDQLTSEIVTRIQTQDALLRAQADLAEAQAVGRIGSWTYDPAAGAVTWSDQMYRIMGVPPGMPAPSFPDGHRQYIHADDFARVVENAAQAGLQQTGYEIEFRVVHPDAGTRYVAARAALVQNAAGDTIRHVGTLQDITERRVLELRRQQMTARLQAVLRCAQQLLAYESLDDVCRRGVELAREQLGIERCGLFLRRATSVRGTYGTNQRGETVDEHALSFSYDAWHETLHQQSDAPRWRVHENRPLMSYDGADSVAISHGWITETPLMIGPGRVLGVMYNDSAISGAPVDHDLQDLFAVYCSLLSACIQRAMTLDELRTSEERARVLVEHAPVALYECDVSHCKRILESLCQQGVTNIARWLHQHPEVVVDCIRTVVMRICNQSYLNLLEADSIEDAQRGYDNMFTPAALATFREQLIGMMSGATSQSHQSVIKTLRGNERHISVNWVVVPGYEATFERTLVCIVDTTESHAHLQQIEEYQEQLRAMAAELTLTEERERRRLA